ncbi:uncharacterized protein BcabD6B2_21890 [Babesia caballi]|uniref:Uncharacterized protein n=1 Tax=Babesia caballi TaxID=5871 RepID=A0AAV4LRY4_BABCB|nr:hypothetical protein BcabD6B2_21890 [Babesia caballi]
MVLPVEILQESGYLLVLTRRQLIVGHMCHPDQEEQHHRRLARRGQVLSPTRRHYPGQTERRRRSAPQLVAMAAGLPWPWFAAQCPTAASDGTTRPSRSETPARCPEAAGVAHGAPRKVDGVPLELGRNVLVGNAAPEDAGAQKVLRPDRRRHDHELERGQLGRARLELLAAKLHHAGKHADQQVTVEVALVGLVDDQHAVARAQQVLLYFLEQDAVGHELDLAELLVVAPVEAVLVADEGLGVELQGDLLVQGQAGDAADLRDAHDGVAAAEAVLVQELRHLRGLAAAGVAGDDHDVVVLHCVHDLLLHHAGGQLDTASVDLLQTVHVYVGVRGHPGRCFRVVRLFGPFGRLLVPRHLRH